MPQPNEDEAPLTSQDSNDVDSLLDDVLSKTDTERTTPQETPVEETPQTPPAEESQTQPMDQQTPSAEPQVPQAPQTPVEPEDPEVDQIENPRNLSPSNTKNIATLRSIAKTRLAQLNELKLKMEELTAQLQAKPAVSEDLQKELADHRQFRRLFDLQNDTEFVNKYDNAMKTNRDSAYALLAKNGLPEEQLNSIKQRGFENIDGEVFQEEIIDKLMAGSPEQRKDAVALKKLMESTIGIAIDKENALKNAATEGSDFQKKRSEEAKLKQQNYDTTVEKRVREVQTKVPWAQLQQVPAGATPEIKARIERENEFYNQYIVPRFRLAMYSDDPQVRVDTAMAAILAYKYSDELDNAYSRIKQLTDELNGIRAAGKSRSPTPPAAPKKTMPAINDVLNMRDDEAIDAGIDAALNRTGKS